MKIFRFATVGTIVLSLLGIQPMQANQRDDWSFLLHPARKLDELDYERLSKIFDSIHRVTDRENDAICNLWVDELIMLYVETWPDFEFYSTVTTWRDRWINAFALSTYKSVIACAVHDPAIKLWSDYAEGITPQEGQLPFFCGRFTDRELPGEVEDSLRLLIRLAFKEDINSPAWSLFTGYHPRRNIIELNPDVAFYLFQRQSYLATKTFLLPTTQMMGTLYEYRYGKLDDTLTLERRAEVVAAARKGDAGAILSTTAACKPYEAIKNSP